MPEEFPTEEEQTNERERLFKISRGAGPVGEHDQRKCTGEGPRRDPQAVGAAPALTTATTRAPPSCSTPKRLPAFHDPFAGGGAIPLEAQRLGLESYASDLNPVAVLINKAMIEIPPKFAGRPPVNPVSNAGQVGISAAWKGAAGLADDVRYYGKWMRDEAEKPHRPSLPQDRSDRGDGL